MPILDDIMDHDLLGPAIRQGREAGREEGREEGRREEGLAFCAVSLQNALVLCPIGSTNACQSSQPPKWASFLRES
jgi:hypothetical protein